jgi:hypothetical protein
MAVAVVIAGLRAAAACTTTPDLDFVSDASTVAVADATFEASPVEASAADAADVEDASSDARNRNTCPDAAPPNVDQCCGRVRCVGKGCAEGRCDDCRVCAVSSVCCIKKANAAADCVANAAACK